MTNFEHYKKEILNITDRGYNVAVVNNEPTACGYVQHCEECQLENKSEKWRCHLNRMKWLCEENVEQPKKPKLTKKERQFCELVETGWIARNKTGDLYFYEPHEDKPYKLNSADTTIWRHDAMICFLSDEECDLFHVPFSFITWDDEEPWSIEDLLKLEVEE